MPVETQEISVKGRMVQVPGLRVGGASVVATGGFLRTAVIHDEEWLPQTLIGDPATFIEPLKAGKLRADLFSFTQCVPATKPKHPYYFEWDNVAIIHVTSYKEWWDKLSQESRRNVRIAGKKGVTVEVAPFDDKFVRGIMAIYNEAPVRLGKPFWHYGKSFEVVQRENGTYADRSDFIGAFFEGQMIGFIKIVYVDQIGNIMQILANIEHQDKRTTNALINKAVELCAAKGVPYLKYCKYVYGPSTESLLTEFKRRNGFEQVLVPQYYVPLTVRGRLALKLHLHHGIKGCLPPWLFNWALRMRAQYYGAKARRQKEPVPAVDETRA